MTKTTRRFALLLAGVLVLSALVGCKKKEEAEEKKSGLILDYASEGVIELEDADSLQKAYNDAAQSSKEKKFTLRYKNDAYSTDGKTFSCRIGNSTRNEDDIFILIYADSELTDELYMSKLLRPGMALETVELNRAFPPGDYTFYVPHTKIRVVDGEQTIVGQVVITMDFHVNPE